MTEVVTRAVELLVLATPAMFGVTLVLIAATKALVALFPTKASPGSSL